MCDELVSEFIIEVLVKGEVTLDYNIFVLPIYTHKGVRRIETPLNIM